MAIKAQSFIFCVISVLILRTYSDPISPLDTQCGSVLSGVSGAISFKPFESYKMGERCIWVLRVPRAVSYDVVLYNRGLGTYDKIIATALNLDQAEKHTELTTIDTSYAVNGSVAIITFYSYSTSASTTGFSLYYNAVLNETNQVSFSSVDYVISSNSTSIRHPSVGGVYSNNELSTFVFTPNFQWVSGQQLTVNVTVLGMEQNCDDVLSVYYLPGNINGAVWKKMGRICGVDDKVNLSNNGVILMVFQTDESLVNSGFQLLFNSN
ncbi:hypothetical protein Ocin01_07717 [Orchesella cincta]|uniref:CUB domain-containing protein n=1 Tax=Orchesella cincta TaxID=48709 RepID=A0A1D2N172_ORCCI|nr:hypothetical protein Ocin01_07717 [Orchesella cincta]